MTEQKPKDSKRQDIVEAAGFVSVSVGAAALGLAVAGPVLAVAFGLLVAGAVLLLVGNA